jgi:putrescine transport system substrate-binding protein
MHRPTALTALALLAAGAATAQENVLHVYNWSDYIAEDTLEKFTAETGIEVVYDVYDSNETLEARLLAGRSGYDIVVPTSSFLQRQIAAGVHQPLNKELLPNLANMDPALMEQAAAYDPGNEHGVIYMWGTIGLGYDASAVTERLGEDAPVDSWALVFDPENAAALADCGIAMLDSPTEMLPVALAHLGLDPTSSEEEDLTRAAELLETIRPHVRYFHSSQYISDLANGEICVAIGYSGDVFIAADRAAEAGNGIEIAYSIPTEGTMQWFDMMAIPADAPNPEAAHAFIDFVMRPEITADITNYVFYASANTPAMELIDPEIRNDPAIFPSAEVLAKLFPSVTRDARTDRLMTRLWTRVRTGQ